MWWNYISLIVYGITVFMVLGSFQSKLRFDAMRRRGEPFDQPTTAMAYHTYWWTLLIHAITLAVFWLAPTGWRFLALPAVLILKNVAPFVFAQRAYREKNRLIDERLRDMGIDQPTEEQMVAVEREVYGELERDLLFHRWP